MNIGPGTTVLAAVAVVACNPELKAVSTVTDDAGGHLAVGPLPADDGASSRNNEPPVCAEQKHEARPNPIDVYLLIDSSGSMTVDIPEVRGMRKWDAVRDAMIAFLKDPKSAGLGVGLGFFPVVSPKCTDSSQCGRYGPCQKGGGTIGYCQGMNAAAQCNLYDYNSPWVSLDDLPQAAPQLVNAFQLRVPDGGTPMGVGVAGGLAYLRSPEVAKRRRPAVMILATDGLPDHCTPFDTAGIAAMLAAAPEIATYIIGVYSSNFLEKGKAGLAELAAGAGKGPAFIVDVDKDLSAKVLDALNQIRQLALPCDYSIPTGGVVDFSKVNLSFTSAAGDLSVIGHVSSAADCRSDQGGWYYDVDPARGTPTRIIACSATCQRFAADPGGRVELRFGCKTKLIE